MTMRLFFLSFFSLLFLATGAQPGSFEWAFDCGNPPNTTDTKTTLASDTSGNFFLAGEFLDTATFGGNTLVSAGGTDIYVTRYTPDGNPAWSLQLGGSDYDFVQKVQTDSQGNLFVAGFFYGTTQVGDSTYTSLGSQDIFIAKFDGDGQFLWSVHFGGEMADYAAGLAIDPSGGCAITGYFYNQATIGDTTLVSTAGADVYLAVFGPDGEFEGAVTAGGSSTDQVKAVSCDNEGNLLISGSFYNDISFGDTTLTTEDPIGVFVAKYDAGLDHLWSFQLDGSYLGTEAYVSFDPDGDLFLAGNFTEDIDFGPVTFVTEPYDQDIYVAKYRGDGKFMWADHGSSLASDQVVGADVDVYGNLYITGHYLDDFRLGDVTLPYTLCCGSREVFVINVSMYGEARWGQQISGARTNVQSIDISKNGNLYVSGLYTDTVTMGPYVMISLGSFKNYATRLITDVYTYTADDRVAEDAVSIYPNPANRMVRIGLPGSCRSAELDITGTDGRIYGSFQVTPDNPVDISWLRPGTYIFRISTSGKVFQKVLVKM